ncbi:MAG: biosynthetic-type acetolactate synthase large subunit [Dehalococcoidia bacterium]|jgi:acetolactate synthase-1/2/3 large subunit|nr:biosynthetic-type acetolactate synthase large subunit [Dehalococcoidia bacterium]
MKRTGAQILCESLMKEGVDVIFGISGGTVIPIYDAFSEYPQIRRVLVRHEQAAAHAAAGYARVRKKAGVCIATSGPGATNLVTGIADAYMDSTPLVVITGQVATHLIGKDAFQECDITGITLPIVKHNYLVDDVEDLARVVKEAFYIAQTGRPGPVLIDIPKNVQLATTEFVYPDAVNLPGYKPRQEPDPVHVANAAELLNKAERPVIIAGRGVIISQAHEELRELAERYQAPVVHTMLGLGSFPPQHDLDLGMLGHHGTVAANKAVQSADLVLAIGTRLGDRATMSTREFARNAVVVHIDIEPAEIGKNVVPFASVVGDAKAALRLMNPQVKAATRSEWLSQVRRWREEHPLMSFTRTSSLSARAVIRRVCRSADERTVVVTGVGQHQMFAAQEYCSPRMDGFVSSGGHGTMGFELPAALGAQMACPEEQVWVVAGDGGFQMTLQELSTIVQEGLSVKVALIRNGYLGMVRQWQDLFQRRNYVDVALHAPDFVKLAEAYGIAAERVAGEDEIGPALERARRHKGPYLIDFVVDPEENVYPMVAPGQSLDCMIEAPEQVAA